MHRPDLSTVDPAVRAYIEYLESQLNRPAANRKSTNLNTEVIEEGELPPLLPDETPTTQSIISVSRGGLLKRTYRHLYTRQRRNGMGVFEIELPADDQPALLAMADESAKLLVLTDRARAFHLPVIKIPETPLRAKGQQLNQYSLPLEENERIIGLFPNPTQGYIAIVSEQGQVRRLRHQVFGEYMKAGTGLFDIREFGKLAAACTSDGESDLLIATRQGLAIRFAEKLVPATGCRGIRLSDQDTVVSVSSVTDESGVFLLSADGRGTIRLMNGFSANKAPGAGGKLALKTDELVGAATAASDDEIFIISGLCKIIRFSAGEIPAKDGVVQGVNCMSLRNDACTAFLVISSPPAN